ncbi:MAG: aminotransferase class V-fold PLP-dependent enzyme [Steroidobacteraceae bacterium]
MNLTRRDLIEGLGTLCALGPGTLLPTPARAAIDSAEPPPASLPDRTNFQTDGIYLDGAFVHPMGLHVRRGYLEFLRDRVSERPRIGPGFNARDAAVEHFARLINADRTSIAVVPSTMEGENLIGAALGLGKNAGVVTDAYHYDPSLVIYGELARRGMPLSVVAPRTGIIELADIEEAIEPTTRMIAVSLVSAETGFQHDLKALCAMAHRRGVLVYADIIQAAGAVPIDVKAAGVDFCCCGSYKWLMGDFGAAFLYVRPDRLSHLKRVQVGWRQIRRQVTHVFPFDPPGSPLGEWTLGADTASKFEVSTPAWGSLACDVHALAYLHSLGVEAIVRHRQPLIERLQEELPKHGFLPMTPRDSTGPIVVFAYRGAARRFDAALRAARITLSTYENRIRISPSVYNNMDDIDRLLRVLTT